MGHGRNVASRAGPYVAVCLRWKPRRGRETSWHIVAVPVPPTSVGAKLARVPLCCGAEVPSDNFSIEVAVLEPTCRDCIA